MTPAESPSSRRDWLADAARCAALAGIGMLAGGLVVKRALIGGDERCSGPIDCRRCSALADCSLPAASRARGSGKG
jgi:hypothetical protein